MTPIDYNNPNDPWLQTGYDPYKGMSDEERLKTGCLQGVMFFAILMAALALCTILGSCTTTEYIPLPQEHTEHHWHTDSVKQHDSVHVENTTVIRELDSAAMAEYGIQLRNAERAWLVQSREMEIRLKELERMTANSDTVHDSIHVPYPVIREVPAPLAWWQKSLIFFGALSVILLVVWVWRTK